MCSPPLLHLIRQLVSLVPLLSLPGRHADATLQLLVSPRPLANDVRSQLVRAPQHEDGLVWLRLVQTRVRVEHLVVLDHVMSSPFTDPSSFRSRTDSTFWMRSSRYR